jgi:hypothetical protein
MRKDPWETTTNTMAECDAHDRAWSGDTATALEASILVVPVLVMIVLWLARWS